MLFGGNGEKFSSEKFTREKFTPSDVLDSQKTESQVQNTKVSPITQTVIDGDRGKTNKKLGGNVNNFFISSNFFPIFLQPIMNIMITMIMMYMHMTRKKMKN